MDGFTHDMQSRNRGEDEAGYQSVKHMLSVHSYRGCHLHYKSGSELSTFTHRHPLNIIPLQARRCLV